MQNADKKIKSPTVNEAVYSALRKNIINLTLIPGTTMSEKDISEKMNVSRTPVREAFIKLSQAGLVEIFPQKGTVVSKIDLSKVEEERFLRASLEYAVLDLFIKNKTEKSIALLQKNIAKQEEALKKGQYLKFLEQDNQFHYQLFNEADKTMCWNIIQNNSGNYLRIRLMSTWFDHLSTNTIDQHKDLVGKVIEDDFDGAKEVLKKHLSKLGYEEKEICESYPEYFIVDSKDIFENISDFVNKMND